MSMENQSQLSNEDRTANFIAAREALDAICHASVTLLDSNYGSDKQSLERLREGGHGIMAAWAEYLKGIEQAIAEAP